MKEDAAAGPAVTRCAGCHETGGSAVWDDEALHFEGPTVSDAQTREFSSLRRRLLGIAGRVLGVPADAEDVVQEAYLRLHRQTPGTIASAEAWLVTVVTRLAIDRRRERLALERARDALDAARLLSAHPILPPTRGEPDLGPQITESEEVRAERRADVIRALAELQRSVPPHDALVLLLHDVLDADYRDLAQWLDKTEEACRQLVHRARRKLAQRRAPGSLPEHGAVDSRLWLQALRDRDHRSLVAELLRISGRTEPVVAAAPALPALRLQFDAGGRLALHLGPHLLCGLGSTCSALPAPQAQVDQP